MLLIYGVTLVLPWADVGSYPTLCSAALSLPDGLDTCLLVCQGLCLSRCSLMQAGAREMASNAIQMVFQLPLGTSMETAKKQEVVRRKRFILLPTT